MAAAYAVFANGGFRVEPYLICRIEDAIGALVEEADPPRACADCWFRAPDEGGNGGGNGGGATAAGRAAPRVLGPRETFQMHTMLRDVIQAGTGRRARDLGRADIAGKTGTSNEVRDSWFCGYHKDLAVVAWIGFDDFSPIGQAETGGQAAIGVWMDFMRAALAGRPEATLEPPAGLARDPIDPTTGALAAADDANGSWSGFAKRTSPNSTRVNSPAPSPRTASCTQPHPP
jgi:penicillin-binding protein 1A